MSDCFEGSCMQLSTGLAWHTDTNGMLMIFMTDLSDLRRIYSMFMQAAMCSWQTSSSSWRLKKSLC